MSEVSNFVVGSIRPSGRCSKRQVLELACIFASEQCRQGPRAFLPCLCHVRYAALAPIVALQLRASTPSDANAGQPFTVTAFARGETGGSTKPPAFGMLSWRPPACLSR